MEFRILGPVEVVRDGRNIDLGGPLEKAILARLLLDAGRVVSLDRLIDDLWEGEPPGSANVSVRVRVSKLRKALTAAGAASSIKTKPPGYELVLDPADTSDLARFNALHAAGRAALQRGDYSAALRDIEAALSLWRGPVLAGTGDAPFARTEAARLDEARLAASEDRIEAGLAAGRHAELIVELESLVTKYPLRERLWAQRMTALYRSGRQADALAAFQDLRKILQQELGLDPSPELAELEGKILVQAPELTLGVPARASADGLPTGVVTFLLTDIEGSTELWEAHPVTMADVLEQHDHICARVIASRSGHLIKSKGEGDATLSVFRRATDAVAAALDLREAFESGPWRDGISLRVRMAIHTGEAHERDGDYFGPAVNRAARVRSLADGAQILLSQVAAELVRDSLPAGSSLADLGERSLRGLARAEHVFELVPEGSVPSAIAGPSVIRSKPPIPDPISISAPAQFVGRAFELQKLETLLKEVSSAGLRAVFAAGEPGIGKTRLCSEFARIAYDQGAIVLYGRCDEEPLVPYQPFVESLRRWAASLSSEERLGVPGSEYLAPVVTELATSVRAPTLEDPEVARYHFFEAVASALAFAATAGHVLLVIDDLHWADRPTLQLLHHIIRTRAGTPILALGTYRETDLTRTRPLSEALADFRREHSFERLALSGLDEEEILALLERAASHAVGSQGRALAHALSETTDGNPFFIEQILGNLVETGRLVFRDGNWTLEAQIEDLGIPEGIVDAIGRRLSRLSETCNKALAAAAVLGRDFELDVLTRLLQNDPDEILAAVEEALDVGLVRELKTRSHASFTFSHALVQQALYEELSLARKQRLHLRAAEAIEASHKADIEPYVATLARHLREAGAAAEPGKAIDYSVRAMEAAGRVFAFEEGILHGEAALELADENEVQRSMIARLHERLGDMHYVAGLEYDRSFTHYDAALAGYEALEDQTKVARVHVKLGRGLATFVDVSNINKALENLQAAEEMLGPNPDPRVAGPLSLGLAAASGYGGDFRAAFGYSQRAIEIADAQHSTSMWASAKAFEGWSLVESGRLDDGMRMLEQAWEAADRLDNVLAGFAAAWIACAGYEVDPLEHVRLALRELSRPRQAHAPNIRRSVSGSAGGALAMAGELQRARELFTDVLAFHGSKGLRVGAVGPGLMYYADSMEEEARLGRTYIADLAARGHAWIAQRAKALYQGIVEYASGDIARARTTFEESVGATEDRCLVSEFAARARLAILEAHEKNADTATKHVARCEAIISAGNGWRGFNGLLALGRASINVAAGRLDDAGNEFTIAIDYFRRHNLPFEEAETLLAWGISLATQDLAAAIERIDSAIDIYVSRGTGDAWIERAKSERARIA